MRLCVIPARGGSKRIPRKNIKPFNGKPIIAYAIEAARISSLFGHIIVSTDDSEIAAIARSFGAETPFVRPPELSDDHTPTAPVIAHAINIAQLLGWNVEQVCCIYPAVPLIQVDDLKKALLLKERTHTDFSFPVVEFPAAIQRALKREHEGRLLPFQSVYELARTQDLEPAYYDAGQFYWGSQQAWLSNNRIHSHSSGLVIPGWRVVDIDTPDDWSRAEIIFDALCVKKREEG
jgi:pseudaminic acid cytidylyltransferase